ncbi:MAG: hypothetical protein EB015_20580, partial [Methylocystaceae bacterium]|nr:hypothetical protein [Methylocystaceae bacterium]
YPEGAALFFMNAIPYAWGGTRFEAMDFAAAFVAGNKKEGGGDVYFTKGPNAHADLEYVYELYQNNLGGLMIKAYHANWDDAKNRTVKTQMFKGTLYAFALKYGDEGVKQLAKEKWEPAQKQAA